MEPRTIKRPLGNVNARGAIVQVPAKGTGVVAGWNSEIFAVESGLAEGPLLLRKEFFTEEPADVSGGLQP